MIRFTRQTWQKRLIILTLIGCTTTTDWMKENSNELSHSSETNLPHSKLYSKTKNAEIAQDMALSAHAI